MTDERITVEVVPHGDESLKRVAGYFDASEIGRCNVRDLSREQYKQFMKLMENTNRIWWLLDQRQQMKERGDQPSNAVV